MTHDQRAKMRAKILEAARDRFLEEGLDGLSMRSIAQRVGVSSMTLYLYYESRQDIVRHITIEGFKVLNAEVEKAAKASKAGDRIRDIANGYLKWALDNRRFYSAMFTYLTDDFAVAPEDPLLAGPSNVVADHIKKAFVQSGHSDASAALYSTILWSTLHGIATLQIGGQVKQRGSDVDTLVRQFLATATAYLGDIKAEAPAAAPAKAAPAKAKKK